MHFGVPESFASLVGGRSCLGQQLEALPWLVHRFVRFGEERHKMRPLQLESSFLPLGDALSYLFEALEATPLLCDRTAPDDRSHDGPERETLLARDRDHFRGQVAGERVLPPVMMQLGHELQT